MPRSVAVAGVAEIAGVGDIVVGAHMMCAGEHSEVRLVPLGVVYPRRQASLGCPKAVEGTRGHGREKEMAAGWVAVGS